MVGVDQARRILRIAGLPSDGQLTPIQASWSNEVWIGTDHVVRIANRRGPASLEHELAVAGVLPAAVPYPHPLATGWDGEDRWTVAPRVSGRPLCIEWADADASQREVLIRALVESLKALHEVALPPELAHPPAMGGGPPVEPRKMVDSVRRFLAEVGHLELLSADRVDQARDRLAEVEDAWSGGRYGCVHTDLSFDNAIWDGDRVWLLDLEWACTAPLDYELMWILAYCSAPRGFIEPEWADAVAATDHSDVPRLMARFYPELFGGQRLADRLTLFGLAAFARGWNLRPDIWRRPHTDAHPSQALSELVQGRSWLSLLPY